MLKRGSSFRANAEYNKEEKSSRSSLILDISLNPNKGLIEKQDSWLLIMLENVLWF